MGHLTICYQRVNLGYLMTGKGHFWMTISHLFSFLFYSISEHKAKANTTELHPKVRPTCFNIFSEGICGKRGIFHSGKLVIELFFLLRSAIDFD